MRYFYLVICVCILCGIHTVKAQCPGAINTFPYAEGFETSQGGWVSGGHNSDWTWGTPSKTTITGAGAGHKCWITGGLTTSTYDTSEQSYIQSPCFDFTTLLHPYIQFLINWQTSQNDGGTLQYSIDSGATWLNVGAYGDPTDCYTNNWFNAEPITNDTLGHNTISGQPGGGGNGDGWSGNTLATSGSCVGGNGSNGWVLAKHCLSVLAGQKKVWLRFTFGTGKTCNNYDGIGIDSVTIENGPSVNPGFTYTCPTITNIKFTDTTSCESGGRSWNFGDAGSASNSSTLLSPTHIFSGPGIYTVTLTVSNCGGTFTSSQKVTVLNLSTTETSSTCGTTTGSATVTPTGSNSAYTYLWNTIPAQTDSTATNLTPGRYIVSVSTPGSCVDTVSVLVVATTAATITASSSDTAICPTKSTNLYATGGATYTWQPGNITGSSISVTPASTTVYTVTGVIGTCSNTATVTIHVSDTAYIHFPNIIGICQLYDSIDAGPGFSTYTWTQVGSSKVIGTTQKILVDSSGHYKVIVTKAGCSVNGTDTAAIYFLGAGIHIPLKDTVICQGQKLTLTGNPASTYNWSGPGGFNSSASSITVNPTVTTTYSLTSEAYTFNLVADGDFEQPVDSVITNNSITYPGGHQFPIPFTSTYYDTMGRNSLYPEGDYSIEKDPNWVHGNFSACGDHTTGHGQMMVINGATTPGQNIWGEHIRRIAPYTTYVFTAWATAETASNPPVLQFAINGGVLGTTLAVSSTLCNWQKITYTWTSGASTVADFSIVDQQTAAGGNDFSLDDISFVALETCVDTRKITVDTAPAVVVPNITICGDTATLVANKGFSHYQWSPGTPADTFRTLKVDTSGVYQVTVTAGLCKEIGTAQVLLNTFPKIVTTPLKDSICFGYSVTIKDSGAGTGGTYLWKPSNDTGVSVTISPSITTTYTVVGVSSGKCKDSTTITIKVNPIPNISAVAAPKNICLGFGSTLSGLGGNKYIWVPGNIDSTTIHVAPILTTVYTVTGIDSLTGCSNTATDSVYVHTATGVIATVSKDSICVNDSVTLMASGGSSFTWSPSGKSGATVVVTPGAYHTIYTVTGTNIYGCKATDTVSVSEYTIDKVNYWDTTVLKEVKTPIHAVTTGQQSYAWAGSYITYLSNPNIFAPIIDASETGIVTYIVSFPDKHGCPAHDSIQVDVISDCAGVYVPNAFTPNGDDKNDHLRPLFAIGLQTLEEFKVYNRWGQMVFESTNAMESWDGTFNGKKEPTDTYVYYLKYQCEGTSVEKQGSVELIR